ncbi:adenine nucleotide alpha hydrolase [Pseudorhodoplanes sp.]|uniref:adenine nucleotide alpha hydrolase n=1 Tax=Pseudorhodoplanes sp. TaxID=1934341 RepID=UPI003D136CF3
MSDGDLFRLRSLLIQVNHASIAVSGGVDSLTLAVAAHRFMPGRVEIYHAISPAVPEEATLRVRRLAERERWTLSIFDAGEFGNGNYRRNPMNRCFYCKQGLYGSIAERSDLPIFSGTNVDDLQEYRPGLEAAHLYSVRHPFVECGIDKAGVRRVACELGLEHIAPLPASPCLSSRIETGIPIEPEILASIYHAEKVVSRRLFPRTVRCRVRSGGVAIELDRETLLRLESLVQDELKREISNLFPNEIVPSSILFEEYRSGSAFVGEKP